MRLPLRRSILFLSTAQRKQVESVEHNLAGLTPDDFYGELPEGYKDRLHSHTGIIIGFRDRIKILFGWRIELDVRTLVENQIGQQVSMSRVQIHLPVWLTWLRYRKQRGGGYAEMAGPAEVKK